MKKKNFLIIITIIVLLINFETVSAEIYENYNNVIVSCGEGMVENIPALVPEVISIVYIIIQIAVPVVLVIMGSLDLFKGLSAQKEDEIKKGQQMFVKRLIASALVFFVFAIVKIVISFMADGIGSNIMNCAECFINNECEEQENIAYNINF